MQEKIEIMNVRFNKVTLDEAIKKVFYCLENNKKGYICTPNPEMLLEAEKNKEFLEVLNRSLLNIPDGIGILWAATQIANKNSKLKALLSLPLLAFTPKKFNKVLKERVTGTDLLQKICTSHNIKEHKVYFLGAREGIAKEAAKKLIDLSPTLEIVGTYAGSPQEKDAQEIIQRINAVNPDLLFVAYGAPKQELWIAKYLKELTSVKIAVGIGGAFDFVAGKKKRAPKWMRKLGLEWLYRLFQEPKRFKRIYNATIRFPLRFIHTLK